MVRSLSVVGVLVGSLAGCGGSYVDWRNEAYTSQCGSQFVEGVDVYNGNGTIDWAQVKASGREFAFIKASQGNYNTQANFGTNWAGAKAAGLLRSPYHYFDATIDGVTQANWFLNIVNTNGGLQAGDLPPLLDLECPTSSDPAAAGPDCEYAGNSGWAATATIVQRVFDFLSTVETATGQRPIIYSYPAWFADVGFTDSRLTGYPLFIATYGSCASVPAPWTTAVFWQYSATATVPGISGNCDVDRFFGTLDELRRLASTSSVPDGGADLAGKDGGSLTPDGGSPDARGPGSDAGRSDGGGAHGSSGGCQCQMSGPPGRAPAGFLALLALAFLASRARRRKTAA